MINYLWKFHFNCGRSHLEGLFVSTEEKVNSLINKDVYFGEALGKHSDVSGIIEEGEIVKVDLDIETVEKVRATLGDTWSGYNPIEYLREEEEFEDE